MEDLNLEGILVNRKLYQVISDSSFYEFKRQVEYKCKKLGSRLIFPDR